jgi:antagonist of KipI
MSGRIPSRSWDAGRLEQVDTRPIRVMDGPDADRVDLVALTTSRFVVSARSDRMGLRLDGDELAVRLDPERLSTPVSFGSIQVAGGRPIILGPAGGTMGGYPHVAQVISADLDRLGQLRPGQNTRFVRVGLEAARRLDRERSEALRHFVLILRTAAGDRSW